MSNLKRDTSLERQIEFALCPGEFISAEGTFNFIERLKTVRASIDALLPKGSPKRAVEFFETFLAGCNAKIEEVDDSYGNLGDFVQALVADWVRARRAAGLDAEETIRILLRWKAKDDYGFFHEIERALDKTFNRAERAAFTNIARAQFDAELKKTGGPGRPHPYYDAPYPLRESTDRLKTLYEGARNAQAYMDLCGIMGTSPKDCQSIARILQSRGKLEQALEWVTRGSQAELKKEWPNQDAWDLGNIKRELLKGLGRHEDALRHAWDEFRSHPGEFSYSDLMGCVPKAERDAWHAKAMNAAERADLDSCLDLYIKTQEWSRLADRVRRAGAADLQELHYDRAVDAAKKLAKEQPAEAAALYRGQALQILVEKKSRLYETALRYFAEARRCYEVVGQGEEWRRLVESTLLEHSRKYSFLPGFQRLASGEKIKRESSFLTRAKRRWKGNLHEEPSQ